MAKISLIVAIIALVVAGFSFSTQALKLGTTWNGGVSHTNSQFDAVGGFAVNGTVVISSSTQATLTGLTNTGTSALSGAVSMSATASNTISNGNLIINSTSTGLIIRNSGGTCYLIGINAAGTITTSTKSCT